MSTDLDLSKNVNDVEFPKFNPTGDRLVVKVLQPSCEYHSVSKGGIIIPGGKDESAFVKCEIIDKGPDCTIPDEAEFVHCLVGGGMRGLKPISLANGHFVVDQQDVFFWESFETDASEGNEEGKLITLVKE